MSDARYSQPIEPQPRDVGGPIIRAGFVGKGANKRVGFIFKGVRGREVRVEANHANSADERPRGFFSALARIFGGSR
jgi:hypothetical protein